MKIKLENENTVETKFDQVSKIFAEGLTRRQSLRRIGGGLAGVIVGSLVGRVGAAIDRNDVCAHWCDANFPPGPANGDCKNQAAHFMGPCYVCGPAAPPVHGQFCGGVCCALNEFCLDNVCVVQSLVTCTCGNGPRPPQCVSVNCSDSTAVDTACMHICTAQLGGFVSSACTPGC